MGAFTHLPSDRGSRFTDGTFGVYYTARETRTAILETAHHRSRFYAATREPRTEVQMQLLAAELSAHLQDVRGSADAWPDLYHTTDNSASSRLARELRTRHSWGIAYDSVRHAGGECAAVFRPRALSHCVVAEYLTYVWDGREIAAVHSAP